MTRSAISAFCFFNSRGAGSRVDAACSARCRFDWVCGVSGDGDIAVRARVQAVILPRVPVWVGCSDLLQRLAIEERGHASGTTMPVGAIRYREESLPRFAICSDDWRLSPGTLAASFANRRGG